MRKTRVQKKEQGNPQLSEILKNKVITALATLHFLAKHPHDSFSVTEIAEEISTSKSTASKILQSLQKENLVIIGKITPRLWRVQFNTQNLKAISYKISTNLGLIYQSDVLEYIKQKWGTPKAILLFGSMRKGEDTTGSDIDIAIEVDQDQQLAILELANVENEETSLLKELHGKLQQFETFLERKFRFHIFNRNKVDINLFNNIANGILLFGFLEVKP